MEVSDCYSFKKYTYTDGLFNESIDATYILHLEGNGRLDDIEKQLKIYHPTNTVYIMFNKGFKRCKKDLKAQTSMYDIVDANREAFTHARTNNYSNILVLEDDFIFSPNINDTKHLTYLNNFLQKYKDQAFIYHLGAIPFLVVPIDTYTYYTASAGMHCAIFTKSAREKLLRADMNKIDDWDMFLLTNITRYAYYMPLCNQLFTQTENKANWGQSYIVATITNNAIQYLGLDRSPEPGTTILYIIAKIISTLMFLFVLWFIYYVIVYFKLHVGILKFIRRAAYRLIHLK